MSTSSTRQLAALARRSITVNPSAMFVAEVDL
jgi:hypothetical protein